MTNYYEKVLKIAPDNLIAYWPMWESAGSVAEDIKNDYNGAYTGVTLGQTGIGDGRTCPYFDGANDYSNIYSSGMASLFNGAEGTISMWSKVYNVGVWTDSNYHYIIKFDSDSINFVRIYKSITDNFLSFRYGANGVTSSEDFNTSITDWFHVAITWSATADEVRYYLNGSAGTPSSELGTWAGSLSEDLCVIGASSCVPSSVFYGWLAHAAIWTTPLTSTQIAQLYAIRSVVLDTA